MNKEFYYKKLYPLQDDVLNKINNLDTDFYLTGGTASSRGYLNHRFSEDLDFFVNDNDNFLLWSERIINSLIDYKKSKLDILLKEERFVRLLFMYQETNLKIELINDVPSHIGKIQKHKNLGAIDSPENILANKITAVLNRNEPKDLADIWGFCCKKGLDIHIAISDARSKAAGIFPADLARVLCSVTKADWGLIRWIDAPNEEDFINELYVLGESLINIDIKD